MNRYAIYKQNGEIQRIISCVESQLAVQIGDGEYSTPMPAGDDSTHYINGGVAAPFPKKPEPNATFDFAAKQWVLSTLENRKARKWEEIKAIRDSAFAQGFVWSGSRFDADSDSQQRIAGATQLAVLAKSAGQSYSVTWTLFDNSTRVLSADDMISVGEALGVFVQTLFAKGQAARAQILAATSQADLDAIVWS